MQSFGLRHGCLLRDRRANGPSMAACAMPVPLCWGLRLTAFGEDPFDQIFEPIERAIERKYLGARAMTRWIARLGERFVDRPCQGAAIVDRHQTSKSPVVEDFLRSPATRRHDRQP